MFKSQLTKKTNDKQQSQVIKDVQHYLKSEYCKGSNKEINDKISKISDKITGSERNKRIKEIKEGINNTSYIIYDFETDTHTNTHIPNHVEVSVKVCEDHSYEKSLVHRTTFEGYGCDDKFCSWLFDSENMNSTVIAHNGAGYDAKFVKLVFKSWFAT